MKTRLAIYAVLFLLFSCGNPSQHQKKAEEYFKESKYENALFEINKAIEIEPDSISYYSLRVSIYDNTGRFKEEVADLDKIIEFNKKRNGKYINAVFLRAQVRIQLGLYNEALSDIDYFINNRDTVGALIKAHLLKASILYKLNDYNNSKSYYELVLRENIGKDKLIESNALVGLANLSKSPKNALALLEKAIAVDDSSGLAYGARMAVFIELGEIDRAYDDARKALSLTPDDAILNFNMGQLFANYLNNNDSAIQYFERAIMLSPQSPDNDMVYMNLAVVKHRSGNLEGALVDFKNGEAINSRNDLLLYNYSLVLSDLNKNTEALEIINKAILMNRSVAEYFDTKGGILMALSLFKEAETEFKKAILLNPNFGGAYYNLGYLYGEEDNPEQSIKYYDKAVFLDFDLKATLVNRALQKIKTNRISSACSDLEKAYSLGRIDIKPLIEKYCK